MNENKMQKYAPLVRNEKKRKGIRSQKFLERRKNLIYENSQFLRKDMKRKCLRMHKL